MFKAMASNFGFKYFGQFFSKLFDERKYKYLNNAVEPKPYREVLSRAFVFSNKDYAGDKVDLLYRSKDFYDRSWHDAKVSMLATTGYILNIFISFMAVIGVTSFKLFFLGVFGIFVVSFLNSRKPLLVNSPEENDYYANVNFDLDSYIDYISRELSPKDARSVLSAMSVVVDKNGDLVFDDPLSVFIGTLSGGCGFHYRGIDRVLKNVDPVIVRRIDKENSGVS